MEKNVAVAPQDSEVQEPVVRSVARPMSPMGMLGRRGFLMGMGALGLAGLTGCAPQALSLIHI